MREFQGKDRRKRSQYRRTNVNTNHTPGTKQTYILVIEVGEDPNLAQCALTECLVLKWRNLLDRNPLARAVVCGRAVPCGVEYRMVIRDKRTS